MLVSPVPSPTVLVVEDQPFLRFLTMEDIADSGFAVLGAGSAEEALDLIDTRPEIALVFSDIELPGAMDGRMLAAEINARGNRIRVVLTSGNALGAGMATERERALFVPKPYVVDDVSALLHALANDRQLVM